MFHPRPKVQLVRVFPSFHDPGVLNVEALEDLFSGFFRDDNLVVDREEADAWLVSHCVENIPV